MKYKISDLAKVLGVTTNTLRRYEKNGYIVPERDESDYRWYRAEDISKLAYIRLLRKCGFSHQYIEEIVDNTGDNARSIAAKKLDEIDVEINRLKHLRHWLKDNIQLMDTLKDVGEGIKVRDCPPSRYVMYTDGSRLLTDSERLKTINDFMYAVDEVQHVERCRFEDIKKGIYAPSKCWVIKESDIERLNLYDMIENDKYIEIFPKRKCMYGVLAYPAKAASDNEEMSKYIEEFTVRMKKHMDENGFELAGDVMLYNVNMVGTVLDSLVCMPVNG